MKNSLTKYLRLLKYLKRFKLFFVLAIGCMFLEAWFTIFSFGMLKPVLDLIFKGTFIDLSAYEISTRPIYTIESFPDNVLGLKIAGDLNLSRDYEFRDSAIEATTPETVCLYIDMRDVTHLNDRSLSNLVEVVIDARKEKAKILFVLPSKNDTRKQIEQAGLSNLFVPLSQEELVLARERYLDKVELPEVTIPESTPGTIERFKNSARMTLYPILKAIQEFGVKSIENKFFILSVVIGVIVIATILKCLFAFLNKYLTGYIGNSMIMNLRNDLYDHMLTLDMGYYSKTSVGTMMSHVMADVQIAQRSISVVFTKILRTPIMMINYLTAMILISASLTIVSLVAVPMALYPMIKFGQRARRISRKMQQRTADLNVVLSETFSGIQVVKSYNMENRESTRFRKTNKSVFRSIIKNLITGESSSEITEILGMFAVSLMILIGGYYILQIKFLDPSMFMVFIALMIALFRPMKDLAKVNVRIQQGLAGADRIFTVMDIEPKVKDCPGARELIEIDNDITFEDVSFSYDNIKTVLHDITISFPKGKVYALVGKTGAGKTTLVNLLARFYDPNSGKIAIDSVDLKDYTLHSLKNQIGIVAQDIFLFEDTIANNIAYGRGREVVFEEIEAAANAAHSLEFIKEFPQGFDTQVGGRGMRLSGGQRQRLAIARAIIKNAPILILDEATSSLDNETELLVQDALQNLMKGKTVFVIAHRLSTILHADTVIMMDNGHIIETGNHEESITRQGAYTRLFELNFEKNLPSPRRTFEKIFPSPFLI